MTSTPSDSAVPVLRQVEIEKFEGSVRVEFLDDRAIWELMYFRQDANLIQERGSETKREQRRPRQPPVAAQTGVLNNAADRLTTLFDLGASHDSAHWSKHTIDSQVSVLAIALRKSQAAPASRATLIGATPNDSGRPSIGGTLIGALLLGFMGSGLLLICWNFYRQ